MILLLACFGLAAPAPRPPFTCSGALATERPGLEKVRLEQRIEPTLRLIANSCRLSAPELAGAARAAATLPRRERSAVLARAQRSCAVADPLAPAKTIAASCPPAATDPQGPVLEHLDAGTYAFVRALRAALEPHPRRQDAELVLSSLALAAALEGENASQVQNAPPPGR